MRTVQEVIDKLKQTLSLIDVANTGISSAKTRRVARYYDAIKERLIAQREILYWVLKEHD